MKEKTLLKVVSIILALFMPIWGLLNIFIAPYGFYGQILGVVQILLGIVVLVGIWRLK